MTTQTTFKTVQLMINLQQEQNVEQRLGLSFESTDLPSQSADEGIETLIAMFEKINKADGAHFVNV